MVQRPRRLQVAALCYRDSDKGRKVLVVTSRGTGRWIIPKGWPMRGKGSAEAALVEAWEEAGVRRGETQKDPLGQYRYFKTKSMGWPQPVETLVFPVKVKELADEFPEAHERNRKWVSPEEAANLVHEPELKELLRAF
ncbi:NUDIX hydrolase [Cognatishimia sp. SS12]|uniref:NUDIX hydrolase n=1 Tax=Cognatishimia sp. SS12 TaxID=2979465 RepID=UPI00232BB353|nr:NUDIX hydrolase [Cognatishimia sp. SS12]MDC0736836.1 NUDIX hydrolase [Cognatishimia sp. SS12]